MSKNVVDDNIKQTYGFNISEDEYDENSKYARHVYENSLNLFKSKIAEYFNIPEQLALDIVFFRLKKTHTLELEQELIDLYKIGLPVNTNDILNGTWPDKK